MKAISANEYKRCDGLDALGGHEKRGSGRRVLVCVWVLFPPHPYRPRPMPSAWFHDPPLRWSSITSPHRQPPLGAASKPPTPRVYLVLPPHDPCQAHVQTGTVWPRHPCSHSSYRGCASGRWAAGLLHAAGYVCVRGDVSEHCPVPRALLNLDWLNPTASGGMPALALICMAVFEPVSPVTGWRECLQQASHSAPPGYMAPSPLAAVSDSMHCMTPCRDPRDHGQGALDLVDGSGGSEGRREHGSLIASSARPERGPSEHSMRPQR